MATDSYPARGVLSLSPRVGTEGVGGPSAGDFGPAYFLPDQPHSERSLSTGAVCVRAAPQSDSASPVWPGPALAIALACGLLGPPGPSGDPTRPYPASGTAEDGEADIAMPTFVDPLLCDP